MKLYQCLTSVIPVLTIAAASLVDAQTSGNLTAERWNGFSSSQSVLTLQRDGISNRSADSSTLLAGADWASGQGDYYGVRLRGSVTAPVTGDYTFFIAGDDNTELYLSSDSSRFNKQRIAWQHHYTSVQQWDKYPTQRSKLVHLTAGEIYYIEAQMMESAGGDHLSIGWSYEAPATLTESAIGSPVTQTWTETNGIHTLDVEAGDIWGASDRFAFKHRTWTGDGEFVTRVSSMNNPSSWAKVGLMIRASLDADSAQAMIIRSGSKGMAFQRRLQTAASTQHTGNLATYQWVKLVRKGDVISAFISPDGKGWISVGKSTFTALPDTVYIGLAATDNAGTNPVTATIENFTCQPLTAAGLIPTAQLTSIAANTNDLDDDNLPDDWETTNGIDATSALGNDGQYGDLDNDGIDNLTEYQLGTNPAQKESLLDGLTRERWSALGGILITDLTVNQPRFFRQPSERGLSSNIDEYNVGDSYATRYRGTITVPETGTYTFWISGDDEAELWLSDGTIIKDGTALTNRYGKQKLAWIQDQRFGKDRTTDEDFDRFASQRSRTVTLTAGQPYYIEVLHKEGAGDDHVAVAWQVPGGQREIIPSSAFASDVPEDDDPDFDFLPTTWETQYGLNPADNGITDARDGQYGDWDADGLNNFTEYQLGTDPTNADTDGDGLSDLEERDYYGTDPLVSNQINAAFHTQVDLSQYLDSSTAWSQQADGSLISFGRRGIINYGFTVAPGEEGIFEISITGGASGAVRSVENLPLTLSLNDTVIGKTALVSLDGASSTLKHLTPWLVAGDYSLSINNTNYRTAISLRLDEVTVTRLGGIDTNSNGIADWVENKLANENHITFLPSESAISPLCAEATTPDSAFATLTKTILDPESGLPVQESHSWKNGINNGIYANIPLNVDSPTELTVDFQSGAVTETRQVTWTATNILQTDTLTIRKGDSLKLTAFDGATSSGTFTLTADTSVDGVFEGYLPTTSGDAVTAWDEMSISEIMGAVGVIQGGWQDVPQAAECHHLSISGDSATFQLQVLAGSYTKAVKISLEQTGNDIVVHQLYARYKSGDYLGENFDSNGASSAPVGAGGYGVTSLTLDFLTNHASAASSTSHIYHFDTPGTQNFTAAWESTDGTTTLTSPLAVTVLDANFGDGIDVMAWNERTWILSDMGADILVEADNTLAWAETTADGDTDRSFTVNIYEATTRHTLARLPGGGAILARGDVRGFYIATVDETADASHVTQYADGTYLMRMTYIADNLPANARIHIRTYYQGTTFLNGGNTLDLTAADFDENGIAVIYMEWADGTSQPRMCHYLDVFLD